MIANSSVNQEVKDLLQKTVDSYEFPVQSMIMRPDTGDIVHMINANNLMEFRGEEEPVRTQGDPLTLSYNDFLMEGIRIAREQRQAPTPE